ncbi:MAG: hypothetical protein AAGH79_11505 [Bacteroidota bacterium]
MQENYQDWIDRYLEGNLPAAEQKELLQACEEDPALAETLRLRQKMDHFLQAKAMEEERIASLSNYQDAFFPPENTASQNRIIPMLTNINWLRLGGIAAGFLVVLSLGYWFWNQTPSRLYKRNANHYPIALVPKGGNVEKIDIKRLEDAFIQKRWGPAQELLQEYHKAYPNDNQGVLYLGITHLQKNELEEARTHFHQLAQGNSVYKSEGQWYMALSFLKEGDTEGALDWLAQIPESAQRFSQAQTLYNKLN